jgi:anti-sigma regulatory factor (Ser/Thr protein kinase)
MTHPVRPAFDVRIPTRLDLVGPIRRILEAFLASLGWKEDDVADAGLIATEVIQNAVEHGSRNDGSEIVGIDLRIDGVVVTLDVADPGTGTGPDALLTRDVTVQPPLESPRGRGLYLVHRMSREMDRRRVAGGGAFVRVQMTPAEAP